MTQVFSSDMTYPNIVDSEVVHLLRAQDPSCDVISRHIGILVWPVDIATEPAGKAPGQPIEQNVRVTLEVNNCTSM